MDSSKNQRILATGFRVLRNTTDPSYAVIEIASEEGTHQFIVPKTALDRISTIIVDAAAKLKQRAAEIENGALVQGRP